MADRNFRPLTPDRVKEVARHLITGLPEDITKAANEHLDTKWHHLLMKETIDLDDHTRMLFYISQLDHIKNAKEATLSILPEGENAPEHASTTKQILVLESLIQLYKGASTPVDSDYEEKYAVPTLEELRVNPEMLYPCLYPGGESEGMKRLEHVLQDEEWICKFEKPNTSPNSLSPSTTVLSPYVKFGCLSARTFYFKIREVYMKSKHGYSKPPVSLHGQLFWREFFYTVGSATPCFDQMIGNPICKQIPWNENKMLLEAWENAQTGYPFIDAIMTQLRQEGWIHHLARHAVACFLTRGDLWVSWVHGMKVFEELLLDADWSLNAGNWMWLSCSAFFHQYFRVYSPIAFGKKTDKNGDYIRKYIPVLKRFPPEYIYEPWKAPKKLQEQLGCVIGKDYPVRIVDHDEARVQNLRLMDAAYKGKSGNASAEVKISAPGLKNIRTSKPESEPSPITQSSKRLSLEGKSEGEHSKFPKTKVKESLCNVRKRCKESDIKKYFIKENKS